jgi:hypothetical protein
LQSSQCGRKAAEGTPMAESTEPAPRLVSQLDQASLFGLNDVQIRLSAGEKGNSCLCFDVFQ